MSKCLNIKYDQNILEIYLVIKQVFFFFFSYIYFSLNAHFHSFEAENFVRMKFYLKYEYVFP